MSSPDYYSIMEKRIKYYSAKYDPLNRYLPDKQITRQVNNIDNQAVKEKKIKSVLKDIISFFL